MTIVEATLTCLRKYAQFSGRASRPEFWKFVVAIILGMVVATIVNSAIYGPEEEIRFTITRHANGEVTEGVSYSTLYNGGIFSTVFSLLIIAPFISVTWRRLHDINRPGWLLFAPWAAAFTLGSYASYGFLVETNTTSELQSSYANIPEVIMVASPPIGITVVAIGAWVIVFLLSIFFLSRPTGVEANRFGPSTGNNGGADMNYRHATDSFTPLPHALLFSTGHTGGNRLLDILDQHPWTNCRNEPQRSGSEFEYLWLDGYKSLSKEDFDFRWANLTSKARFEQGAFDRLHAKRKAYLRWVPAWIWSHIAQRTRLRALFGIKKQIWSIPRVCIRNEHKDKIFPVLKVGGKPNLVLDQHQTTPNQYVIHALRRPDAYLQSWYNLYVKLQSRPYIDLQNDTLSFLENVLPPSQFAALQPDNTLETLIRLELIKVRACHESIFVNFRDSDHHLTITFEEFNRDPLVATQRVFAFLGLDSPERTTTGSAQLKNSLFANPHAEKLDKSILDQAMRDIMGDSPLLSLWPELDGISTNNFEVTPKPTKSNATKEV